MKAKTGISIALVAFIVVAAVFLKIRRKRKGKTNPCGNSGESM